MGKKLIQDWPFSFKKCLKFGGILRIYSGLHSFCQNLFSIMEKKRVKRIKILMTAFSDSNVYRYMSYISNGMDTVE